MQPPMTGQATSPSESEPPRSYQTYSHPGTSLGAAQASFLGLQHKRCPSRWAPTRHMVQRSRLSPEEAAAQPEATASRGGVRGADGHTMCSAWLPDHCNLMIARVCRYIWLLHNLVDASFDLLRYLLLGDQLKPWELHPMVSYTSCMNLYLL